MTKTAKEKKLANRARAKKWREQMTEKGGKLVQVPLDKKGVAILTRLKGTIYKSLTVGQLVGLALGLLDKETSKSLARRAAASASLAKSALTIP